MRQTLLILAFALIAPPAQAQTASGAKWPDKPMRIIVPFPPGGTTDILARMVGAKLTESHKQPVVIDNRAGASGMIGGDVIIKSPADGHTLGVIISTHAIGPALFTESSIDPSRDFAPVTLAISVANIISVHPSVPATSIGDLIKLAKARPGTLSFGSAGTGTVVHLTGELLKSVARIDITHVPYKGGGPALIDLIGGQIPMGVQNITTVITYVRSGKLRALGISGLQRSPALPNVPTVAEQGFPGFEAREWYGFVAPGGTPRDIVTQINRELVRIIGLPDIRTRLLDLGADIVGDSPEQFGQFMKAELVKWSKLIKDAGIRLE